MEPMLEIGAKGPHVVDLQRSLNQKLAPNTNLKEDGDFGSLTLQAVRNFQEKNWLGADGKVGACAWNALKGREKYVIFTPLTLIPQHTDSTCWSAATAMLLGVQASIGPGDARLDPSGGLFNDSGSPNYANLEAYARSHGLTMLYPQSRQPSALAALMRAHGRLMMNMLWDANGYAQGRGSSGHMVVIAGIRGDDSADGTTLRIYDPWPVNKGSKYSVIYGTLMRRFPVSMYTLFHR